MDLYADNVMFETDFPHTVALMPGSGHELMSARETIEANLAGLPPTVLRKILSDNRGASTCRRGASIFSPGYYLASGKRGGEP